jgi:type 1 fimbria pilin
MRLCGEQSVPVTLFGSVTDTPQMGPQPTDILANLLQDCENVDLGMMFERRAIFGLAYITRANMQNQNPSCILDYSKSQIVLPLQPTDDDALTRNDIIATRGTAFATGSSFEVQKTSGPMSINDPPNGVGLYQYSVTANLFADTQLPNFAAWLMTLGTVDQFRYPVITIDMTRIEVSDGTFQAVAGLDIGNFLQIINAPPFLQNPIDQLCFGFAESMNAFEWTIAINAVPQDPWTGQNLPSW